MTQQLCLYLVCMMHILHTSVLLPSNTGVRITAAGLDYAQRCLVYGSCAIPIVCGVTSAYCHLFQQAGPPPIASDSYMTLTAIIALGTRYSARHIIRRYIHSNALTQLCTQTSTAINNKIGSHSATPLIQGAIGCIAWQYTSRNAIAPLLNKVQPIAHRNNCDLAFIFVQLALPGPYFDFIGAVCMPNHSTRWFALNTIITYLFNNGNKY